MRDLVTLKTGLTRTLWLNDHDVRSDVDFRVCGESGDEAGVNEIG